VETNRFVDAIRSPLRGFALLGVALALLTAVLAPLFGPEDVSGTIALVYLLVTLLAAAIWGHLIGSLAAVASDLIVNFFFVAPRHTFTVQEPAQAAQLAVFLAVAFIGASMLGLLRRQATLARSREAEANTVLGLTHAVVHSATPLEALEGLCEYVAESLHADGCAIFGGTDDLRLIASSRNPGSQAPATRTEVAAAMESRQRNTAIHLGGRTRVFSRLTGRKPGAPVTIIAFPVDALASGALRVTGRIEPPPLVNASRLLSSFAAEASTAVHRANLAEAAQEAEVLRRADQMKSALLSSVSHDLRSPLTAIKAAADSLRDTSAKWTAADTSDFIETIGSQTDRLVATVDDLLQMSRLESGAVAVQVEPLQAADLLAEVVHAEATGTAGRNVRVDAPDDLWLLADYRLLHQAVGNLLQNAARYSTPGTPITLRAERAGQHVRLTVADCGPGIPTEDVAHVFEKFYRGVQTNRTSGTGLGLTIVRSMVELCDGTVEVRSSPAGTEFSISLPAAEVPE